MAQVSLVEILTRQSHQSVLIILDTIVHHISNELEDMWLLKPICNYNCMQLCFILKKKN